MSAAEPTPKTRRRLKILLIRSDDGQTPACEEFDTLKELLAAGHVVIQASSGRDATRFLRNSPVNLILIEGRADATHTVETGASLRGQSGRLSARYTPVFLLTTGRQALNSIPWYVDAALRAPLDPESLVATYLDFLSGRLNRTHRGLHMTPLCDIGAAIDRLGGDVELYQDLVRRFLDDTAGGRARVRTAVERLDAAELHRASHSLKGLAASIGATKVTEALAELEALGKRGESDHFLEAWRRFVSDLEQSTPELAAYLPRDQEWAHRDN